MKIAVLGGDGFCGWPASLHLSDLGHDVLIVDNLSRRRIDEELGASSLTPIVSPEERLAAWLSGVREACLAGLMLLGRLDAWRARAAAVPSSCAVARSRPARRVLR